MNGSLECRKYLKEHLGGKVAFIELFLRTEILVKKQKERMMTYVTEDNPIENLWAGFKDKYGEFSDDALAKLVTDLNSSFCALSEEEGSTFRIDVSERTGNGGFD